MPLITVFTPTFNRAYCLHKCYESLLRQKNKNFCWMIIDDGSTDNTAELVAKWQGEPNGFEIRYIQKENGGLHTGYNEAIKNADTELMICIDSDDYLTDTAVEDIVSFWSEYGSVEFGGIIGLDVYENGDVIAQLPQDRKSINSIDLLMKKYKGIKDGDRKLVIRTELYKQVAPMQSFGEEKNFNPHYMHLQIAKKYDYLVLNKPLCVVEYQQEGMANNILKQFYNSPNSFAQTRRLYMSFEQASFGFIFRQCIHYVSSCRIAKMKHIVSASPKPICTLLAYPFGVLLESYIKKKCKCR